MANSKNVNLVRSLIIGVVVLVAGIFGYKLISKSNEKPPKSYSFNERIVQIKPVDNTTIPLKIEVNGRLKAVNRMDIIPEVTGILENNNFRPGATFQKGSLLYSVDNDENKSALEAQRSSFIGLVNGVLADIKIDFPDSYDKWKAYSEELSPNRSLPSIPEMDDPKLTRFLAGRGVLNSYYAIASGQERNNKFRIYAPFTGTLVETTVDPGGLVRTGQPIGTFVSNGPFELEVGLSPAQLQYVPVGSQVELMSTELGKTYTGKVVRINQRINPGLQLVSVFVSVTGKELREGMYLEAEIKTKEIEGVYVLDRRMIRPGNKVFLVNRADSTLREVEVQLISSTSSEAVVKGLPDNEWIPTTSVVGGFEGLKVSPKLLKN
jgi:multidrug efflux pump subunit AcrA (membrane-fusion protein)